MNKQTIASGEHLEVIDGTGAHVSSAVAVAEDSEARGVYKAVMTGPLEEHRARYVELMQEIARLETGNILQRVMYGTKLKALKAEFEAIPTETKWEDTFHNLVTTVGGNNMLDNHLSGSAYTAAWYMGLISATSYTTGPALADTMASHAGWVEDQNYTQGARPTTAWNAAASKSKSLSTGMVYTMNATTTIKGCFLTSNSTKGGTTGVLFSAGLFTGGDQPVVTGNTLTVSYTASV
jgi:hypothetical protein